MGSSVGRDVERAGPLDGGVQHGAVAGRRRGALTVRIRTVVQHHPARAALLGRIAAEIPDLTVVIDPGHDGPANAWRSYRACLDEPLGDATHLLILQDDAAPCSGFLQLAHAAIAAKPVVPVSFFVAAAPRRTASALELAACRGDNWALIHPADWVPTVALCLPAAHVSDLRGWADTQKIGSRRTSDDAIVGDWMRDRHVDVWATVPNLVQHDDSVPSLMGNAHLAGRNPARVAVCWIGGADGRQIVW